VGVSSSKDQNHLMGKPIRPTEWSDVEYLSTRLRTKDVEELLAFGWQPLASLEHGFNHSWPCYTILTPTGDPMGMLGVVPCQTYEDFGVIWLLGTDDILTHSKWFLRHSRPVLAELYSSTGCKGFWNRTYIKNIVHHNWLRWLGFKFIHREGDFLTFVRLKDRSCVVPQ
jgi:hypothetical protein